MIPGRRLLVGLFGIAVLGATACNARSPLDPGGKAALDRVALRFGESFGSAVRLQNGTPTFYSVTNSASLTVTAYAIDGDGVYTDVTRQTTLSSSNLAVAVARPSTSISSAASVIFTGAAGQVTVTATYSGMNSSLTFVAITARPPAPALVASMSITSVGDVILFSVGVSLAGDFGQMSLSPGEVQLSSSDPAVVSVSGSALRANGPGTADITFAYANMQATYRVTVPPFARLALVP